MAAKTDLEEKITEAITTGEKFSELFYKKMDTDRHTIDRMYLDTATLAWNGNAVDGQTNIKSFLLTQIPKSNHHLQSLDSQPVPDAAVGGQTTVLVQVAGTVAFGANPPIPFQQNFIITAKDDRWKIAVDNFRSQ